MRGRARYAITRQTYNLKLQHFHKFSTNYRFRKIAFVSKKENGNKIISLLLARVYTTQLLPMTAPGARQLKSEGRR